MIFKRKKNTDTSLNIAKNGLFNRLKNGLGRTGASLSDLFLGSKQIDENLLQSLEDCLLMADVGIETTEQIIKQLQQQISRKAISDPAALLNALKTQMQNLLQPSEKILTFPTEKKTFIMLVVGINGAGKTTTIGKLAQRFKQEGKQVMLAAGDTFRAAAVEQLQNWGERHHIPVIAQSSGADSAAVIFDAVQAAKARNIDILIADTAGRLHTQTNLMEELKKVIRVIKKADSSAPHEILLILDASSGQNALQQAKQFQQATNVSGIALTKLDGTAKGGIIFAIAAQLGLPIRFIGIGEKADDLQVFNAADFVNALLKDINSD